MSDLLNKEQKIILDSDFGKPVLVSAGPGAGKTFVVVERIKKIVQQQKSEDILVLTFSKKAKRVIKKKLNSQNIFTKGTNLEKKILTFHSFGHYYAKSFLTTQYSAKPVIADEFKIKKTIKNFCYENVNSLSDFNKHVIDEIIQLIKNINLKCHLSDCSKQDISPEEEYELKRKYIEIYLLQTLYIKHINIDEVIEIHQYYCNWKRKQKMMDFEDSLIGCLKYFYEKPDIIKKHVEKKYKYIFVDEFQDTNNVQFEIVYELSKYHNNVFCVGDPRQSIFGFSGSSPQVFDKFIAKFPGTQNLSLTQNYRSTADIIKIASKFSKQKNHLLNKQKDLFTEKKEHGEVNFFCGNSLDEELEYILTNCQKLISKNPKVNIIVLFRSKIEKKKLVKFFNERKIKFFDLKKDEFKYTAELGLIVAACKHALMCGKNTDDSYLSAISKAPKFKLSKADLTKFLNYKEQNNLTWLQTYNESDNIEGISEKGKVAIALSKNLIKKMESCQKTNLKELIPFAYSSSSYENEWKTEDSASSCWKMENVEKYIEKIDELNDQYPDIMPIEIIKKSWKEHSADDFRKDEDINIHISTIHTAKGLEYDAVFLYALWKEVLPSLASTNSENIYLEEVNLAYVGITRARKFLFFTTHKDKKDQPSDFYFELKKIWESVLVEIKQEEKSKIEEVFVDKKIIEQETINKPDDKPQQEEKVGTEILNTENIKNNKVENIEMATTDKNVQKNIFQKLKSFFWKKKS